jgi:hypothetical protein
MVNEPILDQGKRIADYARNRRVCPRPAKNGAGVPDIEVPMSSASDGATFPSRDALMAGRTPCGASAQENSAEEWTRRRATIDAILALRDSGEIKPVTLEEILAWRHEGHRY